METTYKKYLDPKNDLTFRRIFGEHPHIMKSFLNSVLPLQKEQYITELTYEDPAMLPELPELKHSIVDVRCVDNNGRRFIVEMQMYWTNSFKSRMLFNAGKAYVKQIDKGHKYSELHPVYGLSLVDDIYLTEEKYKNKYYHHYRLAHQELPEEELKGIELVFIELPKFKAQNFTDKKIRNLWLRFLTEINEDTTEVAKDLYSDSAIRDALEKLHVSAFNKEELAYYDKYWDRVRVERTAIQDAVDKVIIKLKEERRQKKEAQKQKEDERRQKEEAQKREIEAQKREIETNKKLAKRMLKYGESIEEISKETGLSKVEIEKL